MPREIAAIYTEMEEEVPQAMWRGVITSDYGSVVLKMKMLPQALCLQACLNLFAQLRQFEAQFAILEHKNVICAGYSAVMHFHKVTLPVCLAILNFASCI